MQTTSPQFKANVTKALADANLQIALRRADRNFTERRSLAVLGLPEFETLRDRGVAIKNDVLANLDH